MMLKYKRKSCIAEWMTRNNVSTSPKLPFNLEWYGIRGLCLLSVEKKK